MMTSDGAPVGTSVRTHETVIARPDGALQPLVEVVGVPKRYRTQDGTIPALDPVTLVIGECEFISTMRGWKEAIDDRKAGVDALMAAFPDTNRRFAEPGLPLVIERVQTPATKGEPLGWMAEENWKATIELLKTTGLEGDRPLSAYYRNLVE
jgi:hypothetical protein